MKNKWRFFAVTLAVVLCMTVFSVTAYAGGGDMDEPTDTMQPEDAEICVQGCELTDIEQTLTVNVTENADGSHRESEKTAHQGRKGKRLHEPGSFF